MKANEVRMILAGMMSVKRWRIERQRGLWKR